MSGDDRDAAVRTPERRFALECHAARRDDKATNAPCLAVLCVNENRSGPFCECNINGLRRERDARRTKRPEENESILLLSTRYKNALSVKVKRARKEMARLIQQIYSSLHPN